MDIIAQILSIVGCALMIFSFQFKNNRNLFIAQAIAALTFGASYVLLGAFGGAFIDLVCLANGTVLFLGEKYRKKPVLVLICLGYAAIPIISLLAFNGVWTTKAILEIVFGCAVAVAQVLITLAMWKDDGKTIRFVRLFITSPAWLIYNVVVFSLGGIICETFSIISIIVSFIRYGKDGFEK